MFISPSPRIQRAWRTALERKQGWQEEPKNDINHFEVVSQEDAFPTNLPTEELGQNLTLVRNINKGRERKRERMCARKIHPLATFGWVIEMLSRVFVGIKPRSVISG